MLDCVDCHTGIKDLVHESKLPPPDCNACHAKEAKDYATSIHGLSHKLGASAPPIAGIVTARMAFCR